MSLCLVAHNSLIGRVYKNWYLSSLETSAILNLAILAIATYYIRVTGGSQAAVTFTSVGIAFTTFIGIVFYHIKSQIRDSRLWRTVSNLYQSSQDELACNAENNLEIGDRYSTTREAIAPTVTWIKLREPLLEAD